MATMSLGGAEFDALPQSVKEFAAYKSSVQNCSEKTICEYLLDLRTFFRYFLALERDIDPQSEEFNDIDISGITIEDVKTITPEFIYRFLLYSGETRRNGWAAKSRKLSAVKAYFKVMTATKHYLETNPTADMEGPKKHSSLPKFLSLEESLALLDAVRNDQESQTIARDYAIITLFLNCGMRLSELVGINIHDIDREMKSLRVIGKGHKERLIYLNDACRAALKEYLSERPSLLDGGKSTDALFLSTRKTRISNKTVQWMVYKYLDMAGLDHRGFSVHKLRHTAATLMYQTGEVDVRVLKDILGHEQLNTTQIYTHVSDANMARAIDANPLASVRTSRAEAKEAAQKSEED